MKPEEQTEEDIIILDFTVSDEALENAADTTFSLGNCTEASLCPAPNDPRVKRCHLVDRVLRHVC